MIAIDTQAPALLVNAAVNVAVFAHAEFGFNAFGRGDICGSLLTGMQFAASKPFWVS